MKLNLGMKLGWMGGASFASGLSVLAAYLVLGTAGMSVSPQAHASGGQCKWEGGAGSPTYPSCKWEDCAEDGGAAVCTEPEFRPPSGISDGQADGEGFNYGMCDMGPPSIPKVAAWCVAEGGTWVVTGGGTQECQGLSPDYPGVGSATSEGAATSAGDHYANPAGSSCPMQMTGDSGWGLTDLTDQNCASGTQITKNNGVIFSLRRQDFATQPPCAQGSLSIKYRKSRQVVCPNNFASRAKPNGDLQCFQPIGCCTDFKNPVDFATGAKLHREFDYRAADGLEFGRFYNSQSKFRPKGTGGFAATGDDYWRHSYSRRLTPIVGNPNVSAYLQRDDGSLKVFDANGVEVLNVSGAADRLQNLGGAGWQLTLANSDVENYSTAGKLTSVTTRAGVTTTLTYDTNGRLSTIANSFGRTLTLGYDTNGRLSTLTLPDSGQVIYGYDSKGRPSTVTHADSTVKSYQYEDSKNRWLLTGITDESNTRFATYVYDGNGYVASEEHAGGANRTTFSFGDPKLSSNYMYYTDAFGKQRYYLMSRANGVFKIQVASEYSPDTPNPGNASFDANGNYAWRSDLNGRTTNYVYDLARNLETSRTEGLGSGGTTTAATRTVTTQWHSTLRLPMQIDVYTGALASGNPLRRTTFTRDSAGNILTRTISDPGAGVSRTWTYTYDSFGHVLTEDGPRTDVNDVTTYTYNNCSTGSGCGLLASVTNALNQTTTYDTYNANGTPTQITDPNGRILTLAYDARQLITDRCVGAALPACIGGELTHIDRWPTGLLKRVTLADGSYIQYGYDAAHRLTQIEDGAGNRISYVLDAMGNRTSKNALDPYGTLLRSHQQLYNTLGQLWQVLTAARMDSQATVFGYDASGNQTSTVGPMYRATTSTYDALNRVVQVVDPANGSTLFSYDANDDLTAVTDPRGRATTYAYSGLGDLKTLVSPDFGTTNNSFDSGGNLKTSTDARGAVSTYVYDAANRVQSVSYKIGSTTDQTISFAYDAGTNGKGRLVGASDANHALTWSYDALGRVVGKTQVVGGISLNVSYAYTNGHLTSLTTPSGRQVSYGYANGRVASITVDGTTLLSNVTYDPFGPVTGWSWGNGTLAVRTYDLDGRISLIDSAGLSVYTHHDDGSIAARNDDVASSFSVPTGSSNVSIDPSSNRIQSITGAMPRTYNVDAAGNTLSNGNTVHSYYNSGRMKTGRLSSTGVDTTYLYNALGQRIRKSGGSAGTLHFAYDEAGHLLGEYGSNGGLIQETIWLGNIPVATIRPNGGGYEVFYVHTDQINTPRRISRPMDNVIVWRWESDAYGEAAAKTDPDGDGNAFAYNLRFPGQYFDVETGLNYNYYRDYDPATGRYLQSDPIGQHNQDNLYLYALDNPESYFDPRGDQVPEPFEPRIPRGGNRVRPPGERVPPNYRNGANPAQNRDPVRPPPPNPSHDFDKANDKAHQGADTLDRILHDIMNSNLELPNSPDKPDQQPIEVCRIDDDPAGDQQRKNHLWTEVFKTCDHEVEDTAYCENMADQISGEGPSMRASE